MIDSLKIFLRRDGCRRYFVWRGGESHNYTVHRFSTLLHSIVCYRDTYNQAVGVFTMDQLLRNEYDTIFLDIDRKEGESLEDSYRKMRKCVEVLGSCRVYFSGAKGFHIFCDMNPIRLNNYRLSVVEWLREKEILDYVDMNALDNKRVSRIPFTVNLATGVYCVPVSPDMSLEEIMRRGKACEDFELKITPVDRGIEDVSRVGMYKIEGKISVAEEYYPACIKKIIANAESGHLTNEERVVLVKFLTKVADSQYIHNIMKKCSDYEEDYTDYQIRYNEKGKAYGCKKLILFGFCPLEDVKKCPYYPSANTILGVKEYGD